MASLGHEQALPATVKLEHNIQPNLAACNCPPTEDIFDNVASISSQTPIKEFPLKNYDAVDITVQTTPSCQNDEELQNKSSNLT